MNLTMKEFTDLNFIDAYVHGEKTPEGTLARGTYDDFKNVFKYTDGKWQSVKVTFIEDPAIVAARLPN